MLNDESTPIGLPTATELDNVAHTFADLCVSIVLLKCE